jgi:hypothetical protein
MSCRGLATVKISNENPYMNQLYVNLYEIDDEDFDVCNADKKLNRLFYGETYDG